MAGGVPPGTPHPVSDGIEELRPLPQVKYLQMTSPDKNGEISSQATPKSTWATGGRHGRRPGRTGDSLIRLPKLKA